MGLCATVGVGRVLGFWSFRVYRIWDLGTPVLSRQKGIVHPYQSVWPFQKPQAPNEGLVRV